MDPFLNPIFQTPSRRRRTASLSAELPNPPGLHVRAGRRRRAGRKRRQRRLGGRERQAPEKPADASAEEGHVGRQVGDPEDQGRQRHRQILEAHLSGVDEIKNVFSSSRVGPIKILICSLCKLDRFEI